MLVALIVGTSVNAAPVIANSAKCQPAQMLQFFGDAVKCIEATKAEIDMFAAMTPIDVAKLLTSLDFSVLAKMPIGDLIKMFMLPECQKLLKDIGSSGLSCDLYKI